MTAVVDAWNIVSVLSQVFHQQLQHLSVLLRQPVHQSVDLRHPGLGVVQLWRQTEVKTKRGELFTTPASSSEGYV